MSIYLIILNIETIWHCYYDTAQTVKLIFNNQALLKQNKSIVYSSLQTDPRFSLVGLWRPAWETQSCKTPIAESPQFNSHSSAALGTLDGSVGPTACRRFINATDLPHLPHKYSKQCSHRPLFLGVNLSSRSTWSQASDRGTNSVLGEDLIAQHAVKVGNAQQSYKSTSFGENTYCILPLHFAWPSRIILL